MNNPEFTKLIKKTSSAGKKLHALLMEMNAECDRRYGKQWMEPADVLMCVSSATELDKIMKS